MRHLVPDSFLHQLFQVRFAVGQSLMRPLENRDPVRQGEALENAAGGERTPLIESQQCAAWTHPGFRQLLP